MLETRELILKHAFVLFLKGNYTSVSLEDIQVETGLSRGGLYHHFKQGKKQIFKEVIDEYLLPSFFAFSKVGVPSERMTLHEAIGLNLASRKEFIQHLRYITSNEVPDFFYFKMAFQASEYYEDFSRKVSELIKKEQEAWEVCIKQAIESGEIRSNLKPDAIARSFLIIPQGLGLSSAFNNQLKVENLEETYYDFYDLVSK